MIVSVILINSFSEIEALFSEVNGNTIIQLSDTDSVRLDDIEMVDLSESDFILF